MTIVNLSEDLRQEMEELLGQLETSLTTVIRETDTRIALPPDAQAALTGLGEPLPESGCGAVTALECLGTLTRTPLVSRAENNLTDECLRDFLPAWHDERRFG